MLLRSAALSTMFLGTLYCPQSWSQHQEVSPTEVSRVRSVNPYEPTQIGNAPISARTANHNISSIDAMLTDFRTPASTKSRAVEALLKIITRIQDESMLETPRLPEEKLRELSGTAWEVWLKHFPKYVEQGGLFDSHLARRLNPPESNLQGWLANRNSKSVRLRELVFKSMGRTDYPVLYRGAVSHILVQALEKETDIEAKNALLIALGALQAPDPKVIKALAGALADTRTLKAAARALEGFEPNTAQLALPQVRDAAERLADATELPRLLRVLRKNPEASDQTDRWLKTLLVDPEIQNQKRFALTRIELFHSLRERRILPEPLPPAMQNTFDAIVQADIELADQLHQTEWAGLGQADFKQLLSHSGALDGSDLIRPRVFEHHPDLALFAIERGGPPWEIMSEVHRVPSIKRFRKMVENSTAPQKRNIAMYLAVLENNVSEVERLFDPNAPREWLDGSVSQAAAGGRSEVLKALVARGAKSEPRLLEHLAKDGQKESIQILLRSGADPRVNKSSALLEAAIHGHVEIAKNLIEAGALVEDLQQVPSQDRDQSSKTLKQARTRELRKAAMDGKEELFRIIDRYQVEEARLKAQGISNHLGDGLIFPD